MGLISLLSLQSSLAAAKHCFHLQAKKPQKLSYEVKHFNHIIYKKLGVKLNKLMFWDGKMLWQKYRKHLF